MTYEEFTVIAKSVQKLKAAYLECCNRDKKTLDYIRFSKMIEEAITYLIDKVGEENK